MNLTTMVKLGDLGLKHMETDTKLYLQQHGQEIDIKTFVH